MLIAAKYEEIWAPEVGRHPSPLLSHPGRNIAFSTSSRNSSLDLYLAKCLPSGAHQRTLPTAAARHVDSHMIPWAGFSTNPISSRGGGSFLFQHSNIVIITSESPNMTSTLGISPFRHGTRPAEWRAPVYCAFCTSSGSPICPSPDTMPLELSPTSHPPTHPSPVARHIAPCVAPH